MRLSLVLDVYDWHNGVSSDSQCDTIELASFAVVFAMHKWDVDSKLKVIMKKYSINN